MESPPHKLNVHHDPRKNEGSGGGMGAGRSGLPARPSAVQEEGIEAGAPGRATVGARCDAAARGGARAAQGEATAARGDRMRATGGR